jgi:hypothetical protein
MPLKTCASVDMQVLASADPRRITPANPTPPTIASQRGLWFWAGVAALAAVMLCYVVCAVVPGYGICHDDSVYLVTAKALAEGKGYTILSLPQDVTQTKYPPLFPLLLSIVWRIFPRFPDNVLALRTIPFAALIGWLWLTFGFAKRLAHETAALWICVAVASSQWMVFTSVTTMAEPLFGFLTLATVLALEKARTSTKLNSVLAATLFAVLAYLTRTAGISLVVVGLFVLALSRRWRGVLIFAAACGLTGFVWSQWQHQARPAGTSIEAYYTAQNYSDSAATSSRYPLQSKIGIVAQNAYYVFSAPTRLFSVPIFKTSALVIPMLLLLYWMNGIFWMGVLQGIRKLPLTASLCTGCCIAMLLLWVWQPDRLMLPVLPILITAFWLGAGQARGMKFLMAVVLLCMLIATIDAGVYATRHHTAGFGSVRGLFVGEDEPDVTDLGEPLDYRKLSAVYSWIHDHTASDAVVFAGLDPALYLYTERRAIRPYAADGMPLYYWNDRTFRQRSQEFDKIVQTYHPEYLVETGIDGYMAPYYFHLLRELRRAGRIELATEVSPHYRIFRFVNSGRH